MTNYISFPYIGIPHCSIWGGESTVNIGQNKEIGQGGRNQELILNALIKVLEKDITHQNFIFLSIGTDGIDGNSENMGAFLETEMIKKISINIDSLKNGLIRHDSANTLPQEFIIKTGQTFINVSDIIILLLY